MRMIKLNYLSICIYLIYPILITATKLTNKNFEQIASEDLIKSENKQNRTLSELFQSKETTIENISKETGIENINGKLLNAKLNSIYTRNKIKGMLWFELFLNKIFRDMNIIHKWI